MLNGQVANEIVRHQIRIAAGQRRAHRADHLQAGVGVLGGHMIEQRHIAEAHFLAVRTGEALRLIGGVRLARVVQIEVGPGEDALHRMVGRVACADDAILVAIRAQIVVVAHQAFVAATAKITFQA